MSVFDLCTKLARDAVDLPDGWNGCIIKTMGHPTAAQGIIVVGAVCPPKMRGPDKGAPNWTKRDRSTVREVFIPYQTYAAAWEQARRELLNQSVNAEMGEGR